MTHDGDDTSHNDGNDTLHHEVGTEDCHGGDSDSRFSGSIAVSTISGQYSELI